MIWRALPEIRPTECPVCKSHRVATTEFTDKEVVFGEEVLVVNGPIRNWYMCRTWAYFFEDRMAWSFNKHSPEEIKDAGI